MNEPSTPRRVCREVQAQLPALVDGSLPSWRRRLVGLHLGGCDACRDEHERQQQVAAALEELGAAAAAAPPPPEGLLDTLLGDAHQAGLRGRAAVPVRGAVSGARPALTTLFLLAGAAIGVAIAYGGWRGSRAIRRR
jgi:anti-sigma factor RsiW